MELGYGFSDLLLTSHAGLPAFSHLLKAARLPAAFGPSLKAIPDSSIFTTQIALLALGKSDFEAVSAYRNDPAFTQLLGLKRLPSAEILRQRLDGAPQDMPERLHEADLNLLQAHRKPLANRRGFVPLDIDTTPMDNSGSHREGVSYTYKGFDGFHPLLAYRRAGLLVRAGTAPRLATRPGGLHPLPAACRGRRAASDRRPSAGARGRRARCGGNLGRLSGRTRRFPLALESA